jgi:hypothetical protein
MYFIIWASAGSQDNIYLPRLNAFLQTSFACILYTIDPTRITFRYKAR